MIYVKRKTKLWKALFLFFVGMSVMRIYAFRCGVQLRETDRQSGCQGSGADQAAIATPQDHYASLRDGLFVCGDSSRVQSIP
jgi:hypothetical protein